MPTTAVCDFCSAAEAVWQYPVTADIATTSQLSGRTFDYGRRPWVACDTCALTIDEDRFGDLLEHSLRHAPRLKDVPEGDPRHGVAMAAMRSQRADLYAQFATSHGPRRPLT